jgi:hypothetical protein
MFNRVLPNRGRSNLTSLGRNQSSNFWVDNRCHKFLQARLGPTPASRARRTAIGPGSRDFASKLTRQILCDTQILEEGGGCLFWYLRHEVLGQIPFPGLDKKSTNVAKKAFRDQEFLIEWIIFQKNLGWYV